MSDSTKRAVRTTLQVLVAVLTAIPTLVSGLPHWAALAQVVAVAGVLSKAVNALEDAGLLPAWLKDAKVETKVEAAAAVAAKAETGLAADLSK